MIGVLLALLVLTIFTIIGDARELGSALSDFQWIMVIPIFLLTIWNYWWRFLKWEMYLEALDVPVFLLDLALQVPFGRASIIMDVIFVACGIIVAFFSWTTMKEQL